MLHNKYLMPGGEDGCLDAEEALLRRNGHEVDLYREDNAKVEKIGAARTALRTIWSRESYREVRRKLRAAKYDVISSHNTFPLISPSVYYAARKEGVAVVQTLHNYRLLCPGSYLFRDMKLCESCLGKMVPWRGVVHGCYRGSRLGTAAVAGMLTTHRALGTYRDKVDAYIALTEFTRSKFIEGGLPGDKIIVKPNFVDPDPGRGSGSGNYVLFVGRLSEEKGLNILFDAWQKIGSKVPLKIAGQGPMISAAKEAASKTPGIELLGPRSMQEVFELMGEARAVVVPSLWYEGMPRTIIESFATGTPVIASNIGSMAEIIEDRRTGLQFKCGDADDLVNQVEWMMANPAKWNSMRDEARREFESKFTADNNYRILMEIFERARANVAN